MNCDLMVQYIKFVADRLLVELECEKVILETLKNLFHVNSPLTGDVPRNDFPQYIFK